ncbi:MAG: hemolysin family protein [Clostridiales bacterium]|nr:hemolysin family protein [Clostridiales bacterium]
MRYVFIIILMVLFSAYFSASEISFNASNKLRLKKAAEEGGSRSAALAYKISEDFTTALSAILIGNNLANIAASTAATVIAMNLLLSLKTMNSDGMASLVSTVVMTLIILIFGEIVPKIIARNNADAAVRLFAWPTRILTWILYPLVWLVMRLIHLLSGLWGKDDEDAPTVTEEELSSIIETVEEEGVIDEEKSELLQSAIDFRDTTVEEIMTPRIDMLAFDIADSPEEIETLVDESRYSRLPVYEDSIDNIIGILYLNHYYKKVTDGGEPFDLRSILMKPSFIHKTMKLPAALSLLRERKTHLAIVVDEFGGTLGLVTMEDILEELVGDIWDESDEIVHPCVKTGENTYEVSGDMNIDDFFAEIEFEPREFECEYSTVGGWAIEMLDADPHVGDSFSYRDIPLEEGEEEDPEDPATTLTVVVSAMDDMRVTKLTVLVTRPETEEENES